VWAAAATFFTILSGQWVHRGNNAAQLLISAATTHPPPLSSVAAEVPVAIAQVVDRGLAFDKSVRWQSARAMQLAGEAAAKSTGDATIVPEGGSPEGGGGDADGGPNSPHEAGCTNAELMCDGACVPARANPSPSST
jgi:hypothetical protein